VNEASFVKTILIESTIPVRVASIDRRRKTVTLSVRGKLTTLHVGDSLDINHRIEQ